MKNKLKLIDLNILSTYMGKFLTLFVTLLVFGLTVSALFSGMGGRVDGVLRVAVSPVSPGDRDLRRFGPLGNLLSSQTRRRVTLFHFSSTDPSADLYILSLGDFLKARKHLDLIPLFEIFSSRVSRDAAVVITADSSGGVDYDSIHPSLVAFAHPFSPNGFWVQLAILEKRGFRVPERLDQFRFEGSSHHSVRIVQGVQWGHYKLGACRMSDLLSLMDEGLLHRGEVHVIAEAEALPEILFAAPREKANDFVRILEEVSAVLSSQDLSPGQEAAVVLLKSAGVSHLSRVDETWVERAGELADYQTSRF